MGLFSLDSTSNALGDYKKQELVGGNMLELKKLDHTLLLEHFHRGDDARSKGTNK